MSPTIDKCLFFSSCLSSTYCPIPSWIKVCPGFCTFCCIFFSLLNPWKYFFITFFFLLRHQAFMLCRVPHFGFVFSYFYLEQIFFKQQLLMFTFGKSLPHSSINCLLIFSWVDPEWIKFYKIGTLSLKIKGGENNCCFLIHFGWNLQCLACGFNLKKTGWLGVKGNSHSANSWFSFSDIWDNITLTYIYFL